jgi:hypothetical protein
MASGRKVIEITKPISEAKNSPSGENAGERRCMKQETHSADQVSPLIHFGHDNLPDDQKKPTWRCGIILPIGGLITMITRQRFLQTLGESLVLVELNSPLAASEDNSQ